MDTQKEKARVEQLRIDGDTMKADAKKDGAMGIKAQIKHQIVATLSKQGKVVCHWPYQAHSKVKFPYLFPIMLAKAFGVELDKVCDCIAELIEGRDIRMSTNLQKPVTSDILQQAVEGWMDARSKQAAIEGRLTLLKKGYTSAKNVTATSEQLIALLNAAVVRGW